MTSKKICILMILLSNLSLYVPNKGSCEHSIEPLHSMKGVEFLDCLE